ncbi:MULTISPECIES: hypothetical protein [unclassified Cyanobium]|uniref:hypothetical protein n=1 Tax=unclassified Cyanobium TaxID=2627006 RepID=UPI0020CFCD15|nr:MULTISPECIES: hypothetical protein [unclassified Cyanobium]MCP9860601.1 hypothetical protein [Cyanobium sp. Cruz-8H5]MCP9867838.1 hypothetical protein [Cyanobium sp. Cruz-8D1]
MPYPPSHSAAAPHPGGFVQLNSRQGGTYQVISIDEETSSCWVRRWPLTRHGSPAFSVGLPDLRPLHTTGR